MCLIARALCMRSVRDTHVPAHALSLAASLGSELEGADPCVESWSPFGGFWGLLRAVPFVSTGPCAHAVPCSKWDECPPADASLSNAERSCPLGRSRTANRGSGSPASLTRGGQKAFPTKRVG